LESFQKWTNIFHKNPAVIWPVIIDNVSKLDINSKVIIQNMSANLQKKKSFSTLNFWKAHIIANNIPVNTIYSIYFLLRYKSLLLAVALAKAVSTFDWVSQINLSFLNFVSSSNLI